MQVPGPIQAFRGWFNNTKQAIANDGFAGATRSGRHLVYGAVGRGLQGVGKRINFGDIVFESEWDVLVILDGCRYDLFTAVCDGYTFVDSVEPTFSSASGSDEWMEKNFDRKSAEMSDTAYITANPFSAHHDLSYLAMVDEVWRYAWDEDKETIPPRPVTDRAITHCRSGDYNRMIIHYMQPHYPFIPDPVGSGIDAEEMTGGRCNVWKQLRSGQLSKQEIWPAYRANLEYVLEDIGLLLNNISANKTVITSDHANGFGEWGIYGHLNYVPVPAIKKVPWCEVSAVDKREYNPRKYEADVVKNEVSDRLEALGYV